MVSSANPPTPPPMRGSMRVRKAVFPAAGWGTRFLPATKAQPKEMLPLVDKPVIQYGVEEAVAAGIEQVIIVTSSQKRAIEDHFDHSYELEHLLEAKGDIDMLRRVREIGDMVQISYVRQKEQLGLGHAVLTPKVFEKLEQTQHGAGGEIQLTDAINALTAEQDVFAYAFEGRRYDAGTTMGWLKASVDLALERPDLGAEFRSYLAGLDLS